MILLISYIPNQLRRQRVMRGFCSCATHNTFTEIHAAIASNLIISRVLADRVNSALGSLSLIRRDMNCHLILVFTPSALGSTFPGTDLFSAISFADIFFAGA